MAISKHWCETCQTHFRADPETHAESYHDDYAFRGVVNGNWRDFEEEEILNE